MFVWAKDKKTTHETKVFRHDNRFISYDVFWRNALYEVDSIPDDNVFCGTQCIRTWDVVAEEFGDCFGDGWTDETNELLNEYDSIGIESFMESLGFQLCDHYFTVDGHLSQSVTFLGT